MSAYERKAVIQRRFALCPLMTQSGRDVEFDGHTALFDKKNKIDLKFGYVLFRKAVEKKKLSQANSVS